MSVSIGISLKLYFGYAETLRWCHQVAEIAADHRSVNSGAVELFVLPSFPAIPAAAGIFAGTPIGVGAQDLWSVDQGAFTGEVSGSTLAEIGCRYVEVGHAERRTIFGESPALVADKTAAALRNGLVPVLCLGEAERAPIEAAAVACEDELTSALTVAKASGLGGKIVVAYEPHWAIGAAEPAADDHILGVCAALRSALAEISDHPGSQVIYGGSAGPGLLSRLAGGVDGLFLGRFAHDPAALAAILDEAQSLTPDQPRTTNEGAKP